MNKDNAKDYLPLVQALAEGKVIQGRMAYSGKWEDMSGEVKFDGPASDYRIKPEPREIWVNVYPNEVECGIYHSREEAIRRRANDTAKQVCFREVIE